jgi:hypothetical protein
MYRSKKTLQVNRIEDRNRALDRESELNVERTSHAFGSHSQARGNDSEPEHYGFDSEAEANMYMHQYGGYSKYG